ncbi:MAG: AraC family transcriptional regulator [Ancalomicrobiaceae bacterium]|nr:AraC family transcriptional regulator [Ancalomicrobiaceae bacterium]
MNVKPLLEVIETPLDRTFRLYAHDYPFAFSGWHHHPEYEIHLIRRSSGQVYVGTYAGRFEPGNVVITGPNLPHMWVSDNAGDSERDSNGLIAGRDLVLQFGAGFAEKCIAEFSDCASFADLLDAARAGIQFSPRAAAVAAGLLGEMLEARGLERMALFFELLGVLEADRDRTSLSLRGPNHECAQPRRLERILAYIAQNFNRSDLTCREIAAAEGMGLPAFSRLFERHVKCTCIEYINRLRIYKACQLLIETNERIISIGLDVGYDTLSTFNRNFMRLIGKTPSGFREERRPVAKPATDPSAEAAGDGADIAHRLRHAGNDSAHRRRDRASA